jgi:hypothetical protein
MYEAEHHDQEVRTLALEGSLGGRLRRNTAGVRLDKESPLGVNNATVRSSVVRDERTNGRLATARGATHSVEDPVNRYRQVRHKPRLSP